jgi:hypothetical protein
MNLAEFPLTVLSTRVDPRIKTLEFSDALIGKNGDTIERKWIITGADKFGLPTASDDEVLLGLMKLTVDDGFRQRKVFFSRYELLRILRWTTEGRSYTRLQRALDRLSGVRIKATNAFYDNESKSHSTRNFGIIDAYEINDGRATEAKPSFFEWSEAMFKSFQVGFIKKLDLQFYLDLSSAISKRLYRFLDKHFWYRSRLSMNLFVLAHEKVGVSRNYRYASSLRQQLDPALSELKECGFISGYEYSGRGSGTEITILSGNGSPRVLEKCRSGGQDPEEKRAPGSAVNSSPERMRKPRRAADVGGTSVQHREALTADLGTVDLNKSVHSEAQTNSTGPSAAVSRAEGVPVLMNSGQPATDSSMAWVCAAQTRAASVTERSSHSAAKYFSGSEEPREGFLAPLAEALVAELVERGLQATQARRLIRGRDEGECGRMRAIVAYYDQLIRTKSRLISRSPVGFLYRAMERPESFLLPGEHRPGTGRSLIGAGRNDPSAGRNDTSAGRNEKTEEARRVGEYEAPPARRSNSSVRGLEVSSEDQLTVLRAQYLDARKRSVQQAKLEVEPEILSRIRSEVEKGLEKLRKTISAKRFQEALDHGVEERLARLYLFPEFDEWVPQALRSQRLRS